MTPTEKSIIESMITLTDAVDELKKLQSEDARGRMVPQSLGGSPREAQDRLEKIGVSLEVVRARLNGLVSS